MRISRALVLQLTVLCAPAAGIAQQQRPLLDQADAAITSGIFADGRALLEEWRRRNPGAARTDQESQARYHVLFARVTTNADSAEDNYLMVAVNYPTTRVAPDALLRLAQGRHARGDVQQAVAYLQRLLADYPTSDQRALAAVWLTRIQSGSTASTAHCDLLRSVDAGTNVEAVELLKSERARICNAPPAVAARRDPSSAPPAPAPAATAQPDPVANTLPRAPTTATSASGRVSVQVGAFRELSGARAVQQQVLRAGFADVRLVRVPGNALIRVRVGRFPNGTAAAPVLARLAAANLSAVLVTDAQSETPVRD